MKNKKLLIFFLICLFIPVSYAQQCNEIILDPYIHLVSKVRWQNTDSNYQFPFFSEFDILRVEDIKFVNDGKCDITKTKFILRIEPVNGYTPKDKHPINYGYFEIPIPDLKRGESIILKHNQSGEYYYEKNGKKIENKNYRLHYIDLDELGDWFIKYDVNTDLKGIGVIGYTVRINNNDIDGFRVYPLMDLLLLEYNSSVRILNVWIASLTLAILALTIISTWAGIISLKGSKKESETLKKIESHLNSIKSKFRTNLKK